MQVEKIEIILTHTHILRECELKFEPTAVIGANLAQKLNHCIHLPLPGHHKGKNPEHFPRCPWGLGRDYK